MNRRVEKLFDLLGKDYSGLAARGVHYFHRPGPTLQDARFYLLLLLDLRELVEVRLGGLLFD
ncbi:hypothetical protein LguiB_009529 [Lonicera macranthoides]